MYIITRTQTIKEREDGTIIFDTGTVESREHWNTERNWNKQHCKLRRTAKGKEISWNIPHGKIARELMFEEKETLPMTDREIKRYERKMKAERHEKYVERKRKKAEEAARKAAEKKELEEQWKWWKDAQTAWRWLAWEHRYPVKDAEYRTSPAGWAYCNIKDTYKVTDDEYEQLKAAYIKQNGGWESIDFDRAPYNGRAWTYGKLEGLL